MFREWRSAPAGLLETMIEYRHYAQAKAMVEAADTAAKVAALPRSPLVLLARVIEAELAAEAINDGRD